MFEKHREKLLQRPKLSEQTPVGFKQEGGKVFIETKNLKIAKYFLDFYVAYKKPTLLMAVRQNGVTALLKHKIRDLLGMHVFNPLYFSLTKRTSLDSVHNSYIYYHYFSQFQRALEKNFSPVELTKLLSCRNRFTVAFVDDLSLPASEISPLGGIRSLLEYYGWYSKSNRMFNYMDNLTFIGSF